MWPALVLDEGKEMNVVADDPLWQQLQAGLRQLWYESSISCPDVLAENCVTLYERPQSFCVLPIYRQLDPVPWWEVPECGSTDVPGDVGDVQRKLLLGDWFASAVHSSGAPQQPVLGTIPTSSTHILPSPFSVCWNS